MNYLGPVAGAVAAGDRRAVGLWISLVLVDVAVLLLAAGGYIARNGLAKQHFGSVVGWMIAGVITPLAVRSPIRDATVRGTTRPVGITFVYDWLRALLEDPLDGRLAELRRRREKQRARELMEAGWTAAGVIGELKDHLDHLQRRSPTERARVLASASKATANLEPPDDLRGIIVVVEAARCGGFLSGLSKTAPS
jgi:hypothetical protein